MTNVVLPKPSGSAVPAAPATSPVTARGIWIDLLLYPGHTLPTAAAPVVVAIGLAVHRGVFAAGPVLAALFASWCIHVAGVFTDNYVLVTRHRDVEEHPELLAALRGGSLTLAGLRSAIAVCLLAALTVAPYLARIVGWPAVLVLGTVGVVTSLGYAAGPVPTARLGIADPVFFVMFAFVAEAGVYAAQSAVPLGAPPSLVALLNTLPADLLVIGLPIGALTTVVLLIDELRDREFDRVKGWRTGVVRFGERWNRAEISGLTVFAYVTPIWLWLARGFSPWVLLTWLTIPDAFGIVRTVRRSGEFRDLFPMTPKAARLTLEFAALLAIGLAAG